MCLLYFERDKIGFLFISGLIVLKVSDEVFDAPAVIEGNRIKARIQCLGNGESTGTGCKEEVGPEVRKLALVWEGTTVLE